MAAYFNIKKSDEIFNLSKSNPLLAKEMYKEYLKEYPEDYITYVFYAGLLIKLSELDRASKLLDDVEMVAFNDNKYVNLDDRSKYLKRTLLVTRLKLLLYQEKYEDFYNLYNDNYLILCDNIKKNGSVIAYCEKKLGILDIDRETCCSYTCRQIDSYDKEEFLDHIRKHLADYAVNMWDASNSIFVPDFPIDDVLEEIKKYIPSSKGLYTGFFEDQYVFKYDECGREDYRMCDYFKVIAFHDTNNFITITPSINCENLPYVDLNYLKKEDKETKVKRLSQIDKFNRRYNKKS